MRRKWAIAAHGLDASLGRDPRQDAKESRRAGSVGIEPAQFGKIAAPFGFG